MEYKTLAKREINREQVNSILASELHGKLEVKTKFTDWLKRDLEEGMFEENIDYILIWGKLSDTNFEIAQELEIKDKSPQQLSALKFSRNAILTLNTSKELSMMSKTVKGKESRTYFISVEKVAKNVLGEERLKLELKQIEQDIKAKDNLIEYDYLNQRLNLAKTLQEFGANFDPVSLSNGQFKTMLPKDIGETLTNVMSDIRVGVQASSITHLIKTNKTDITPKDFISGLISIGLVEVAEYKGKKFNRFIDSFNYYGFSKPFSSKRVSPSSILIYDDRYISLVKLLENEGYMING